MEVNPSPLANSTKYFPKEWDLLPISDIATTTAGGTPSTKNEAFWGGDIRWMNSGELHKKRVYDVQGRITESGLQNSSTKIIPKYCVLIGLAGQGKTRGTVAINMIELCTNQSIAAIFPSEHYIPEYLYYNLDCRYEELRELSTGAGGRGGLNLKIINSIKIPLPPIPEQQAIAEVLSDMDALISAQEALIAKKRLIKQGVMQELLTGKHRLPGFSQEWQSVKISEIADLLKGKGLSKASVSVDGRYPCLLYGELFTTYTEIIEEILSYTDVDAGVPSKFGDVLMPGSTTTVGIDLAVASALLIPNVRLGGDINIIRMRSEIEYSPKFLAYFITFMKKKEVEQIAQGITIIHLYGKDLLELSISLPAYKEQVEIARVLQELDVEISTLLKQNEKNKLIKQGMMQELLTGKTRLV